MSSRVLRCRPPRGEPRLPALDQSSAALEALSRDASHRSGRAEACCAPIGEAQWAGLLSCGRRVLVVGAQSSLTGGATPEGGIVAETAQLRELLADAGGSVRVEAGMALASLQERLRRSGRWFPPVPTYDGAFVGGAVSTDAAGARTFRHGTTRPWVEGLTAMLVGGDVLEFRRGEVMADERGRFVLERADGSAQELQLPMHALPAVPKCSVGYRGGPGLDLVDLIVGSEGSLVTLLEVELRVSPTPPSELALLVALSSEDALLRAVAALREIEAVAALEFLDERCMRLLREDGRKLPGDWLLLIQLELAAGLDAERAAELLDQGGDEAIAPVLAVLTKQGSDWQEGLAALPGDRAGAARLAEIREAAPRAVFERIADARRQGRQDLRKVGGDLIVPFDRLGELLDACRAAADERSLDLAIWGHVSDGNIHPNVLVETLEDLERGEQFLLAMGRRAIELGGSPLAEHGVGRSPLKQRLLQELVGKEALAAMRALKRGFDPDGLLAPGVLFPS